MNTALSASSVVKGALGALAALTLPSASLQAQGSPQISPPVSEPASPPSPAEIVAAATRDEWVSIAAEDLLVMDLAPDASGHPRRVVIQLMPAPFSVSWVENIRTLARARWWDGLAIVRVQDNYVTQWGDPDGEDAARARALPAGLRPTSEDGYSVDARALASAGGYDRGQPGFSELDRDPYGTSEFYAGWPVASAFEGRGLNARTQVWPVHCYGMVGVGRNLSPDAGSGAELYTVIGHAPRHLDRNIALVGRVIEGMQHLSSLPRGTGPLGFYESAGERTVITAVRSGDAVEALPTYQYLSTESESFARYADARANRRDPFFIRPAGGADICNVPVPVRRAPHS